MSVPTDVSEDPKGDPSKNLPNQPDPTRQTREPLFPKPEGERPDPNSRPDAETPGDQRARREQSVPGK